MQSHQIKFNVDLNMYVLCGNKINICLVYTAFTQLYVKTELPSQQQHLDTGCKLLFASGRLVRNKAVTFDPRRLVRTGWAI